jgi:hypothetical protein
MSHIIKKNKWTTHYLGLVAIVLFGMMSTLGSGGGGSDSSTYSISGAVSGDVQQGVTIKLSGATSSTTTTFLAYQMVPILCRQV